MYDNIYIICNIYNIIIYNIYYNYIYYNYIYIIIIYISFRSCGLTRILIQKWNASHAHSISLHKCLWLVASTPLNNICQQGPSLKENKEGLKPPTSTFL